MHKFIVDIRSNSKIAAQVEEKDENTPQVPKLSTNKHLNAKTSIRYI